MAFQDNNLVLGKLRFDTSALDQQMKTITERLNEMKRVAAEAKKYGASGGSSGGGSKHKVNEDAAAIKQITDLLKRQQVAQTELQRATAAKSAESSRYWKVEESQARREIERIKGTIPWLEVQEKTRERISQLINDAEMRSKTRESASQVKQENAALEEQADVFGKIAEMSKIAQNSMAEVNKQTKKDQA